MVAELPEITDQAAGRWAQILLHCGVEDKYLSGNHTPCVLNGCGGKDRSRWDKTKEVMFCSQCGHKNPMMFLMEFLGMDYAGVAKHIRENILGIVTMNAPAPVKTKYEENRLRLDKTKLGLQKLSYDNPAGKYLKNRGISIFPDGSLFYHPGVEYWEKVGSETTLVGIFPAMVGEIKNNILSIDPVTKKEAYERVSYKITYLTASGEKANITTQKKQMPIERENIGACVRLFRFADTLAIAEGIETALAFTESTGIPCWSADSAAGMEKATIPGGVKNLIVVADGGKVGKKSAYTLAFKAKVDVVNVVFIINDRYIVDTFEEIDFLDYYIKNKVKL